MKHTVPRSTGGFRVAITGGEFVNKGAEAMLLTVQQELGRRLGNAEFLMWGCGKSQRAIAEKAGLTPISHPEPASQVARAVWMGYWAARDQARPADFRDRARLWARARARSLMARTPSFDALIDISGFAYGDAWGMNRVALVEPLIETARNAQVPVIFMPQAWGPFQTPSLGEAVRRLLFHEKTVAFPRDKTSRDHLLQLCSSGDFPREVRNDLAFVFDLGSRDRGEAMLRTMGCTHERPIVGIAPNMRVYERTSGDGVANEYVRAMSEVALHLIKTTGCDIVLQANEMHPEDGRRDDRYACAAIWRTVAQPSRCFMTRDYLDASTTKSLVGCFDYLVASRFHSLVFALSNSVPCYAVGWAHKYSELLDAFGLAGRCIGFAAIDLRELPNLISRGWRQRDRDRDTIRMILPEIRRDVNSLFDEVAELIRLTAKGRAVQHCGSA